MSEKLLRGIVCRAIADATARPNHEARSKRYANYLEDLNGDLPVELIEEARAWLRDDSIERWSFRWICEMLRTDWGVAQAKVEAMILSAEVAEAADKGATSAKAE